MCRRFQISSLHLDDESNFVQYIIDSYGPLSASALTFVALLRYNVAGGMTIVGIPMYKNLGNHWALTLLAFISLAATPLPYVLYKWGPALRKKSKYTVK